MNPMLSRSMGFFVGVLSSALVRQGTQPQYLPFLLNPRDFVM